MTSHRVGILVFLTALLLSAVGTVAGAEERAATMLVADASCPKPPAEATPAPRAGFAWVPSAYQVRDGRCVLVPGHWERPRRGADASTSSVRQDAPPDAITMSERGQPSAGIEGAQRGGTVASGCPEPPREATPAPQAGFVWVSGAYEVRDGGCVLVPGHWERPAREGAPVLQGRKVSRGSRDYTARRGETFLELKPGFRFQPDANGRFSIVEIVEDRAPATIEGTFWCGCKCAIPPGEVSKIFCEDQCKVRSSPTKIECLGTCAGACIMLNESGPAVQEPFGGGTQTPQ